MKVLVNVCLVTCLLPSCGEMPWGEAYQRKAKASEATVFLAKLFDAATAGQICSVWSEGSVGPTPPLDVRCEEGPDHACVVIAPPNVPKEPWEYPSSLWEAPEWKALDFRIYGDVEHFYRYALEWHTIDSGSESRCEILVTATGDLDGDGVQSRFQRSTTPFSVDASGQPQYIKIDNELE
ncbi:MAG: hypothetical protein AB1Z98_02935 [Nannocystaceae bacterium]